MSGEVKTELPGGILYHEDALELLATLESASFDAIVTDPPYCSGGLTASERARPASVKYVQTRQKTTWPDFESESMDQNAWAQWTYRWLKECKRVAKDGAPIVIFIDWRQLPLMTTLLQWAGWRWLGVAVWDKTEACRPQRGRFAAQAEYIVWGAKGRLPPKRHVGSLPGVFRYRVEVPGVKLHMTGKPLALMEDLLRIVKPGGIIVDPFSGSGTTLLAARNLQLGYIGIEASHIYYEIAKKRLKY
ncbi:DNA-methyltransferase [Armatimonas rosea]|uniref:Methyltransferase n=1 Tax=Armatimonas rosea TaxID=685828 RepID=A0A7W9SW60_ARMRO|nr:site-specific DNA-methyltransferase [Armatimonas rosea]MBB6053936.1 site-specific DNA-methyltransferase (adenine-specific) [Armatimonas rosea]